MLLPGPLAPSRTTKAASGDRLVRLGGRPRRSSADCTIVTVSVASVKPGAVAVTVTVEGRGLAVSTAWMTKRPANVCPAVTGRFSVAVPAVVRLGASRIFVGSLLTTCTVTPPGGAGAPSVTPQQSLCSPAPTTRGDTPSVRPGAVTVTVVPTAL